MASIAVLPIHPMAKAGMKVPQMMVNITATNLTTSTSNGITLLL